MKILIFNTLYYPIKIGGAEVSVRELARKLTENQLEVGIVTLGDTEEKDIVDGIPVWRVKIRNLFWPFGEDRPANFSKALWHTVDVYNPAYGTKLKHIFKEFGPDIVHTNNLSGFSVIIWDIAKRKGIKTVHTLRDYYLQCPKTTKYNNGRICHNLCASCKFLSIVKKKKSQSVDGVVGISDFILDDHVGQGYFQNAVKRTVYNGFQFPLNQNGQDVPLDRSETLNIGFIGQVKQSKGFNYLIRELSMLEPDKWKLHVAGRINEEKKQIVDRELGIGKVKWYGFIKAEKFYPSIDVLIVPSLWNEPFGRVILEAMLNSKPVIVSKRGGMPEILGKDNNDFIFNPESGYLSKLLEHILKDFNYLDKFNFESVDLIKFSSNTLINGYLEVYKEVLKKRVEI